MTNKEGKKSNAKDSPLPRARASIQDILGTTPKPPRVDPQWAEHHQKLTQLREQFSNETKTLVQEAKEDAPNFSEHMADAGTDSYDRDWALAMLSSEQNVLFEIDQALSRIHNGTYGKCELTGQPIEPDRLKAIPWTRFSTEAQKELETTGGVGRTQLGQLGDYTQSPETTESEEEENGDHSPKEG